MAWTQPQTAGSPVSAALLNELRSNYAAYQNSVTFSPAYSATVTVASSGDQLGNQFSNVVAQLRVAINGLETRMSGNCQCANCCQTWAECCAQLCQSHEQCAAYVCVCDCQCSDGCG
jgi:hypothetical protein